MGFFGMIASLLLGVFFIAFGISRRKQKVLPIILIALGVVFVLIALYLHRLTRAHSPLSCAMDK